MPWPEKNPGEGKDLFLLYSLQYGHSTEELCLPACSRYACFALGNTHNHLSGGGTSGLGSSTSIIDQENALQAYQSDGGVVSIDVPSFQMIQACMGANPNIHLRCLVRYGLFGPEARALLS